MMSTLPVDLKKVGKKHIDASILRAAIIAELDAVSFYEQMAAMTEDKNLKKMLLEVAKEEKTHVGEFQALLLNRDPEQVKELEAGRKEVKDEVGE